MPLSTGNPSSPKFQKPTQIRVITPGQYKVIWKKTQGPMDPDTQCCLPRTRLMNSVGCHLWGWAELKSNSSWISWSLRLACFWAAPSIPSTQAKPNAYFPSAAKRNKSIPGSKESRPTSAEWDHLRLTFNLTLINTSSTQLFYYFPKNGRALAELHRNQALNEFIAVLHTYVQRTPRWEHRSWNFLCNFISTSSSMCCDVTWLYSLFSVQSCSFQGTRCPTPTYSAANK